MACAEALVKEFAQVLRERDVNGLYAWLRVAETSSIVELQALARSIWIDRPAVRLEWSNGRVEGSVNTRKLAKRAMYGRVKFDLLRQRLLYVAQLHEFSSSRVPENQLELRITRARTVLAA